MNALAKHIDINVGLDFDIAIERLQRDAGTKMAAYNQLSTQAGASAADLEAARLAAVNALVRQKSLRRHDESAIRQVLEDSSL